MAIITFPSILPSAMSLSLEANSREFISPFTRKSQIIELPGSRWVGSLTYSLLTHDQAALFRSFNTQLRGKVNSFYIEDYSHVRGGSGAAGVVDGASQTGNTLDTKSWPNSTLIFKDGDYFEINDELKVISGDVTSSGTGTATLTFEPPLRLSPSDLDSIEVDNPTAIVKITVDKLSLNIKPPNNSSLMIPFAESI